MPRLLPVARAELVRRLRDLGFDGPYAGGRHEFMLRGTCRLVLPNPHHGDVSVDLLQRILQRAGVTRDQWLGSKNG
ncbi:MAG: type II toxin-antitoxin system HicA family toxin [Candidatus Latescibacterota bacterium]